MNNSIRQAQQSCTQITDEFIGKNQSEPTLQSIDDKISTLLDKISNIESKIENIITRGVKTRM